MTEESSQQVLQRLKHAWGDPGILLFLAILTGVGSAYLIAGYEPQAYAALFSALGMAVGRVSGVADFV